jgi:DNA-directed RNA polymerase subunit omega
VPAFAFTSPPHARSPVIATIDDLLSKVDSKYTLVHLSAQRAREINDYYHSLGEGLGQYTPPLVEQVDSNKPLSIALEEIAATKIVPQYAADRRRAAEELLGGAQDEDEGGAEIFSIGDAVVEEADTAVAEADTAADDDGDAPAADDAPTA